MCRGRLLSEGRSQPGGERPKEGDGDVYPSCMLSLLFAGADCLAKGARNLEENDPKKAMVMCIHLVCCHFYLQGQTA